MFKKIAISLAACAIAAVGQAQLAEVGTPQRLMAGTEHFVFYPTLSADGRHMLYTAEDYSNLRIYDFSSQTSRTICSGMSGFGATFTPNGRSVDFVQVTRTADRRAMRTPSRFDIATGRTTELRPAARSVKMSTGNDRVRVSTEGSNLIISINGKEQSYSPVECHAGYLWESLSPDGTHVLFTAAGRGTYVADLNGKIVAELGNVEAPAWLGSKHVVAMRATDDGHQTTGSQIVILKADGSAEQAITRPESMTQHPTATADGTKIVYDTVDGRIYMVNVKLL